MQHAGHASARTATLRQAQQAQRPLAQILFQAHVLLCSTYLYVFVRIYHACMPYACARVHAYSRVYMRKRVLLNINYSHACPDPNINKNVTYVYVRVRVYTCACTYRDRSRSLIN